MIKLAPSILSADFARLLEDVKKVEKAGCEYLHIDVMDGHFVPNITLGPAIVKSLRRDVNMVFDTHLMIENPDDYIKDFVDAGSDLIVVHAEACRHLHRTIQNIKSYNVKVGVALNPATSIESIKHIIEDVDMVLIMTVNPGFGGQSFIESTPDKIERLKEEILRQNVKTIISVDGGINDETGNLCVQKGVDILVSASYIHKDIVNNINTLKKLA